MKIMKKRIMFVVLVLASIFLSGCVISDTGIGDNSHIINVQGKSDLTFEPDQAEVLAGISILKDTAEEAQQEANRIINSIIDGLRYKGILEEDIETQQLSLYEETSWNNGKRETVGWRARQTLKIKTQDLTKVGIIVDVATANGANQINGINFGLSEDKEQEFKKEVLAKAAKNAKEKAETIADSLGVKLGKIKRVSESNYYYTPRMYALEAEAVGDMVEEAANIIPSDVTVSGRISVVYYVK